MKIKLCIFSIVFVLMIFTLGYMTASLMIDNTSHIKSTGVDPDEEIDKSKEQEFLWINKSGTVSLRAHSITFEKGLAYTVDLELPEIEQTVSIVISKLDFQILQIGDIVKVHYIYNTKTNEVIFAQFNRDEKGRLKIINPKPIVVLDAGHGGFDAGDGNNDLWKEKNFNLKMTLKLKELLEAAEIRVILTRNEDVYVSLYDRCELSNYVEADLFISNHLNRMNGDVNGTQVIYSLKSDKVFANELANSISTSGLEIHSVYNKRDEKFPSLDYYFVHRYNDTQSYILEYGFADHEGDTQIINEKWASIIGSVAETIIAYVTK